MARGREGCTPLPDLNYSGPKGGDFIAETDELLNKVQENYIAPYKDEVLWDELSYRLAQRDVYTKIGSEMYEETEHMERFSRTVSAQESYLEEFAKHGLENVIIKLSPKK